MKNVFDAATVVELKQRMAQLQPESSALWGSMGVAQALAHCSAGIEMVQGKILPKRVFIGRIIGPAVKRMVLKDEAPIKKNSPTADELVIRDERDLIVERARLSGLMEEVAAAGPAGCTAHPHPFFGKMTAEEWSVLMYKHLDHHLRQFGV
ncbi:MAG: DUF1569 domain-containing protein [Acidobacteriota bacterium]